MTGQIFESGGGTEGNAVDVPLSEPGGKTRFIGRFKVPTARKLARANDRKVDFIIAGTQKGGTSALDAYLRLDPQICLPHKVKEVHFFEADPLFDTGEPDYRLYHAFFNRGAGIALWAKRHQATCIAKTCLAESTPTIRT